MNNDRDHIKNIFDGDGIRAPESLSEENMLAMLEAADRKQVSETAEKTHSSKAADEQNRPGSGSRSFETRSAKKRIMLKRVIAAAAAVMVAVLGISGVTGRLKPGPDTTKVSTGQQSAETAADTDSGLRTFSSVQEIEDVLEGLDDSAGYILTEKGRKGVVSSDIEIESETAVSSDTAATGTADSSSHSETYLQDENVDEADIVKTDGKYIYYVDAKKEVVIMSAKDGETEKLSSVGSSGDIENYIDDIYIKGDTLVTVGSIYRGDSSEITSGIAVYDISDRSKPELLHDFSQTGRILTSRMVGDYVYLVTVDGVRKGGRIVPNCGTSADFGQLAASDICCMPEPDKASYVVLSAVDVSAGKQGRAVTKAILGAGDEVYCNDHNLYAVSSEWTDEDVSTRIVRAALDGTNVKINATTTVPGRVNDQFSMDEKDGYLRIATTSRRADMDVNNLYVLDGELKEAGRVSGFARGESIRAVRYMGDKAYVITYEAIDPLFIIDLADPAAPVIEGEVKIDGFSTLLVPVSSGRLLGIGHATGDNGYGGEYDSGLKLALFDISDPSKPEVLDSVEFENMTSHAQYDHHALMVNSEAGYYAIPYEVWTDKAETGVLLFKAGDKIGKADRHVLSGIQTMRCVYIGDWVYALDPDGNVQSFMPEL